MKAIVCEEFGSARGKVVISVWPDEATTSLVVAESLTTRKEST